MDVEGTIRFLAQEHELRYYIYTNEKLVGYPACVRFDAKWNGDEYSSWGVDSDADLAFFKAFIELIERFCLSSVSSLEFREIGLFKKAQSIFSISSRSKVPIALLHPDNSNGAACHFSSKKAQKAAFFELMERHVILSALLQKIPPKKIEKPKQLSKDYEIRSYFWKIHSFYIVVATAILPNGGYIFGHSCSDDLKKAETKAIDEIAINIIYAENTKDQKMDVKNIIPGQISSFGTYWRFSGDQRAFSFLESGEDEDLWQEIPFPTEVYYSFIPVPDELTTFTGKLVCVRAISPYVQQLFFDEWKDEFINKKIFKSYTLPSFPHIIS